MRQVNIHEAKTHFSELIAAVERGEEIVIARRGKVVAKIERAALSPEQPAEKREFGKWRHRIWVDPSFFEPRSNEELEEWNRPLEALDDIAKAQRRHAG